jgi:hypothetical protein
VSIGRRGGEIRERCDHVSWIITGRATAAGSSLAILITLADLYASVADREAPERLRVCPNYQQDEQPILDARTMDL